VEKKGEKASFPGKTSLGGTKGQSPSRAPSVRGANRKRRSIEKKKKKARRLRSGKKRRKIGGGRGPNRNSGEGRRHVGMAGFDHKTNEVGVVSS